MINEKYRSDFYETEIDLIRNSMIKGHKKCGGSGFIRKEIPGETVNGFGTVGVVACSCRKNFDFVRKFTLSNIPYRSLRNQHIYGKMVIDVVSKKKVELKTEIIKPYVRNLKLALGKPYGFIFLGKNGVGKTFIALKILYYAIMKGYTAHNIELVDFLRLNQENFRDGQYRGLINEISNVDILLVDEVGNESKNSNFVISEFKTLYKKRVSGGKPTILITNYNYETFKEIYGQSIMSMVEGHSRIFDFSIAADVRNTKCVSDMANFFKQIK